LDLRIWTLETKMKERRCMKFVYEKSRYDICTSWFTGSYRTRKGSAVAIVSPVYQLTPGQSHNPTEQLCVCFQQPKREPHPRLDLPPRIPNPPNPFTSASKPSPDTKPIAHRQHIPSPTTINAISNQTWLRHITFSHTVTTPTGFSVRSICEARP
jgi:hypothetical protein